MNHLHGGWQSSVRPRSRGVIKFNEKIELGLPFPWVHRRRDITCRMVMTLPIARTLFSRWQCVVGDRLKGTSLPFFRKVEEFRSGLRVSSGNEFGVFAPNRCSYYCPETQNLLGVSRTDERNQKKRGHLIEYLISFQQPRPLADSADNNIGMDYHVQIVTKDDKLRILKFLRRFFFRDEPLNHCIQLIPESEDSTCLELEEYCSMSTLENNLSLMAVSTSGAIVGVLLNGKMDPPCEGDPEYITSCENPKFKKILRLLRYVDQNVNRSGQYEGLNILEIRILSVDSSWRGKGIAKTLVEKTIEIGKEKGFHMVRADCSSFFSGKLCARLGFERIYELKYADYVDEDGNPVFNPAFPHTSIISYIKKL